MRKDTSFSDRKLTSEEFSQKYWLHGEVPYQYHTASIEDARDEREQFVFNNIRALYDLQKHYVSRNKEAVSSIGRNFEQINRKITKLATTSLVINVALMILICILWSKM